MSVYDALEHPIRMLCDLDDGLSLYGGSLGLARPDYQRPPRTLTGFVGAFDFECVSPAGRGP